MSFLLDKFCSFLPPNIASKYTTSKLQQKLLNYFGNAIIVEKQRGQGKSNTVFSSSITVSEAIHAASNLKAELRFTELETSFENIQSKQLDEEQTLHDAARMLCSSLQSLEMSNEYYPCPQKFLSLNLVNLFHVACLILSFGWLMIVVSIRKIITKGFQMISYENVSLSLNVKFSWLVIFKTKRR